MKVEQLIVVGKALATPTRLKVLRLIRENPLGVYRLAKASGVAHPTVLDHVRHLEAAGLIEAVLRGKRKVYKPTPLCDQLDFEDNITPWHLRGQL